MREYLLSIVAMAFLVSVLNAIGGSGTGKGMRKLLGGILMTLAVFRPIGSIDLTIAPTEDFHFDAQHAVSAGVAQADEMRRRCITQELSAYILTKAAALGLEAETVVTVGADGYPEAVTVIAFASPAERQELTGLLVRELGIEREAVAWIDPHQSSELTPSCEHTNIPS